MISFFRKAFILILMAVIRHDFWLRFERCLGIKNSNNLKLGIEESLIMITVLTLAMMMIGAVLKTHC